MSMNFLNKFVDACKQACGDNLLCVLLIGSFQKQDSTPFSDFDLIAVIKTAHISDFQKIRKWLRSAEDFIDLSILCWDEIPKNPNEFRVGTHGCYQLELILKHASCLYGDNVLLQLGSPSNQAIQVSVFDKLVQYAWWTRRMFVESNRERSMASNYQLNSRLIKMLRDVMYLAGYKDIHTKSAIVVQEFLKQFPHLFNKEEKLVLTNLADHRLASRNAANMSDNYFQIRLSIVNKLYKKASKIFYENKPNSTVGLV